MVWQARWTTNGKAGAGRIGDETIMINSIFSYLNTHARAHIHTYTLHASTQYCPMRKMYLCLKLSFLTCILPRSAAAPHPDGVMLHLKPLEAAFEIWAREHSKNVARLPALKVQNTQRCVIRNALKKTKKYLRELSDGPRSS